nr:sigma-70 family RNA polymerase sigma factor [Acidimicrobiia bacterium]
MEQLPTLHSPERFKSWLFSIAHNTALNRIRQSQHTRRTTSPVDDDERASLAIADPDPMIDPEQMAEAQQAADLVWEAAAALDERTYTVLDLHVRHGLQSAEIAQVLGVTKGNAYTMVSRMKGRFSEVLATVLLVRKGRGECAELAQIIGDEVDAVTPAVRRRADRHVATCQDCARNRALYLEPLRVFAGLLLVPVPAGLQAAVWGAVAAGAGSAAVAGEAAATGTASG